MRINLGFQVTQFHVELLALQLVRNNLFLVLHTLKIKNQHNGKSGDKPYQTYHKSNKGGRKGKNLRERAPVNIMKETDIDTCRQRRPNRKHKDRNQDEEYQMLPRQQTSYQYFVDKQHLKHYHTDKTKRTNHTQKHVSG